MQLQGSITALATPFTGDGVVDLSAWRRMLARQIEGGTQALVVAGSTGEAATLEVEEFEALIAIAAEVAGGSLPVLAGTGMSGTAKTIRQTRLAQAAGADAALLVAPAYVRPTQEGMYRHFADVAEHGGLPVLLYNVPSRTACDLLPETVARLAGDPRIIGIKEAHSGVERMEALLTMRGDGFAVFSGDDPTAARAMLAGADGCVSVLSNLVPRRFRTLCEAARAGDEAGAGAIDRELAALNRFLGIEPNPIPVKALLALLGLIDDHLRLPLTPLSDAYRAQARELAATVASLESGGPEPGQG